MCAGQRNRDAIVLGLLDDGTHTSSTLVWVLGNLQGGQRRTAHGAYGETIRGLAAVVVVFDGVGMPVPPCRVDSARLDPSVPVR